MRALRFRVGRGGGVKTLLDQAELAQQPDSALEKRSEVKEVGLLLVIERLRAGKEVAAEALHQVAAIGRHAKEQIDLGRLAVAHGVDGGEEQRVEAFGQVVGETALKRRTATKFGEGGDEGVQRVVERGDQCLAAFEGENAARGVAIDFAFGQLADERLDFDTDGGAAAVKDVGRDDRGRGGVLEDGAELGGEMAKEVELLFFDQIEGRFGVLEGLFGKETRT